MMKETRIRLLAGCALAASVSFPAIAAAQGAAPAARISPASGKEYILKHKSAFSPVAGSVRNPFWPIGWTPSTPIARTETVSEAQASAFNVSATSVDYPSLAVINGHTYGVGERVPVPSHAGDFAVVQQITDGAVILNYHGARMRGTSAPAPGAKAK